MIRYMPLRTLDLAMGGALRVLDSDGRADPAADPRLEQALVVRIYEHMLRARLIDERMLALQRQGRVGFHVGYRGEEAAIVASAAALRDTDWIFPCYREQAALFWRGFPLERYLDNMFGNAGDAVKGRQMPDHMVSKEHRYASVSSPIGTQISQAVGLAWAAKIKRQDVVAATYFGEGGTSSPDFHTGMNFAGVSKAPVVFLLRNNRWAISTPSDKQTAAESFAGKAVGYGVKGVRCDGNDALAVYSTVRDAVERASRGEGATLVELITYRLGSHSSSDDPKVYRPENELEQNLKLDPLPRMRRYLERLSAWSERDETRITADLDAELRAAIERAEQKPTPALGTLFEGVYRDMPWHLAEQKAECERGPRPRGGHGHG
jgi:pyruvate dehydrogenase E1 component alpha subunit